MPLATGNCPFSKSKAIRSNAVRSSITSGNETLRVICQKSVYLILSVTVRPRVPEVSQWRQTLSMIGSSASWAASKVKISTENVFSAPIDLRMRSARTGRSSMPRAIQ